MTITFDQARDEIFGVFNVAWQTNTAEIAGYVPEVFWQGVQTAEEQIDASKYWCRVSKQTVFEEQATLSNGVGVPGQKRYTASGLVFVQLFCPKELGDSTDVGGKLAQVARNAFRGKGSAGKVWFRNVRINDGLPPEDLYYRFNVVAEFEYDELG